MPRAPSRSPRNPPNDEASAELPGTSTVAMSVRILDTLAEHRQPLGVSELARRLNESKGRIHRHLATMRALGLVSQDAATERYGLGWKLLQLGAAANDSFGIRRIADEHVTSLRDATQHTAVFAIPADKEALVLTSVTSENRIAILVKHGVKLSVSGSAMARVVLAFASPALQQEALAAPLVAYTEASLANPAAVARRLKAIQQRYFDVAVNENAYGISTLAAPVFDEQGGIAGAVGIVGSPYTIPTKPAAELIQAVQACARAVSEALGSRRWDAAPRCAA